MSLSEKIITIAIMAGVTMAVRFLPFIVFSSSRPTPKFIQYLGKALAPALFAMLVVYCLRNSNPLVGNHGLPEYIAVAVTIAVHLWRKQLLLSLAAGTACYMLLLQFVF